MRCSYAFTFASVALAACVVSPDPDPAASDTSTATAASTTRCDPWGCGANSATVGDGLLFDELDSSQTTPNRGGVIITQVTTPDHRPGRIVVRRHEMYARAIDGSGREYHWSALINTVIRLKNDTTTYELQIQNVDGLDMGFWRGAPEKVPFYDIRARIADSDTKFTELICKKDIVAEDPRWTSVPHMALAFEGDRYDAEHKLVSDATGSPWFNLACAGTAPAKMHLQRYTNAGALDDLGRVAYPTTIDQRTALVKMFTADYCGTGQSFTKDGTPLEYGNRDHSIAFDTSRGIASYEAVWKANGPICLDTPRIYTIDDVNNACGFKRPTCEKYLGAWESYGELVTANPPPP